MANDQNGGGDFALPPDSAGMVAEVRPANLALFLEELSYLERLAHVDLNRMIENLEHAQAYGARGYKAPAEMQLCMRLIHSFAMSRTAATINAIEDAERSRADLGPGGLDTPTLDAETFLMSQGIQPANLLSSLDGEYNLKPLLQAAFAEGIRVARSQNRL